MLREAFVAKQHPVARMDHDEEEHGEIEVGNAAGDEHMIVEIQALEGEVEALSLSRKQGDEAFLRGKKVKSTSLCDVRDGRPSDGRGAGRAARWGRRSPSTVPPLVTRHAFRCHCDDLAPLDEA